MTLLICDIIQKIGTVCLIRLSLKPVSTTDKNAETVMKIGLSSGKYTFVSKYIVEFSFGSWRRKSRWYWKPPYMESVFLLCSSTSCRKWSLRWPRTDLWGSWRHQDPYRKRSCKSCPLWSGSRTFKLTRATSSEMWRWSSSCLVLTTHAFNWSSFPSCFFSSSIKRSEHIFMIGINFKGAES